MTPARLLPAAVIGLGLGLRLLRAVARWHEDAWLYSVYPAAVVDRMRMGDLPGILTTFTGLHPPAWPVLHGLIEIVDPRPIWWLLQSVLFSTVAVAVVTRRSVVAGLVLATAPVAVHYSAEVNQYALLTCALAGLWAADPHDSTRVHRGVLAWGLLAGWTHILGGLAAIVAVATLPKKHRVVTLVALAVGLAPLVVGIWQAGSADSTFVQPAFQVGLVAPDLVARFGGLGLVLVVLGMWAAPRTPRLALGAGAAFGAVAIFVGLRVAAPHQFPYLLTVLPPLALLVATVPRWTRLVVVLGLVQAAWQGAFDVQRISAIRSDVQTGSRAVDAAVAALETPWTCPTAQLHPSCSGDALVLQRPPGRNDDDKTRTSAVLWRVRPWWRAPRVALDTVPLSSADHRFGQPRVVEMPHGRFVVYIHDHPRPTLSKPLEDHARVLFVVSETAAGSERLRSTQLRTGMEPQAVGPDWLLGL